MFFKSLDVPWTVPFTARDVPGRLVVDDLRLTGDFSVARLPVAGAGPWRFWGYVIR